MYSNQSLLLKVRAGERLNTLQALQLTDSADTADLMNAAAELRDIGFGELISYSRKVFIPLTQLCRDVCHYCTFATTPKNVDHPFLPMEQVLEIARQGVAAGCKEALFTLGEKPEQRYPAARKALEQMGFTSTLEYLAEAARQVYQQTGLLPHLNPGCMTAEELAILRGVSTSMGIMLESASPRLCEKGMPHYGSPDKDPSVRLNTLDEAGRAAVPFTSGILIGIGETRRERVESLLAIRDSHDSHGHIQEVIVQNFRAKPNTKMAQAPELDLDELLWTIAMARLIFGARMSVQAPPNLSPGVLPQLVNAGINDWGGVSPVTPDFVNPEAPWPHLQQLADETRLAGKLLVERLNVYPVYTRKLAHWVDRELQGAVLRQLDGQGYARTDSWHPGAEMEPPAAELALLAKTAPARDDALQRILNRACASKELSEAEVTTLFSARGEAFARVCQQAAQLCQQVNGETVTFAVNRNINYTNICYFGCRFCAFAKGKSNDDLRGRPYDLELEEVARRTREAWQRGATEVCMQGGIHPHYTGQHYIDLCRAVKQAVPEMHIHAFSPLEVLQGAQTLGVGVKEFLALLKQAGLGTLPGTAAEILDDEVRAELCADKLSTRQWLEVMEAAHELGLGTTATIMFGHIDHYEHWARHLLQIRRQQQRSGGFTEFVPLPFVHFESPIAIRGQSRVGPTFREAVLMHAVARLVLHGQIHNIQASWVKMGPKGLQACLQSGANDLGGSLMNESITRAAGASTGQEMAPSQFEAVAKQVARQARQRNTLYGEVNAERQAAGRAAVDILPVVNSLANRCKPEQPPVLAAS